MDRDTRKVLMLTFFVYLALIAATSYLLIFRNF